MPTLDYIVFNSALSKARRLLEQGYSAEKAAECACPGAWKTYRKQVLDRLLADQRCEGRDSNVSTQHMAPLISSRLTK